MSADKAQSWAYTEEFIPEDAAVALARTRAEELGCGAVSPGTGAQFSILPPQNATGNWVKVVQRVPVRIAFDKDDDLHLLRSGMSVNVDIDTGHSRIPFRHTFDHTAQAREAK